MSTHLVGPGGRLTQLAAQRSDAVAVVAAAADGALDTLTWAVLEAAATRLARRLAAAGVGPGGYVAIGLPTGVGAVVAAQAAWKLGACPTPLCHTLPEAERDRLLALAQPQAVVADWDLAGCIGTAELDDLHGWSADPLPDVVPAPAKALASGGSTGLPKLIVTPSAYGFPGGDNPVAPMVGMRDGDVVLSPGPLYHNQPFLYTALALYIGATAVVCERFRAEQVLDLVGRLRVTYLNVVPTMLGRMLRSAALTAADLSSLRVVMHMAAPCPEWVKRGWIDLIGAEKVYELWGSTENVGSTLLRGDEWLAHPGSVGRPVATEVRIIDDAGREAAPGEVGEIYSRPTMVEGDAYTYLGADSLRTTADGFASVGDLGWMDADGYLYLADRRADLIISGGANVYPAEVEAALSAHPAVADVAVIGIDDDDLGQRVHAVVEPAEPARPPATEDLDAWCRQRIAAYKRPRGYEFVDRLPRAETGKIRRSALRAPLRAQEGRA